MGSRRGGETEREREEGTHKNEIQLITCSAKNCESMKTLNQLG
jgi:hypothetical protein